MKKYGLAVLCGALSAWYITDYAFHKTPPEASLIKDLAYQVEYFDGDDPGNLLFQTKESLYDIIRGETHFDGVLGTVRKIERFEHGIDQDPNVFELERMYSDVSSDLHGLANAKKRKGKDLFFGIYWLVLAGVQVFINYRKRPTGASLNLGNTKKKFKWITSKRI